jgi:predicted metalloprotease
MWLAGAGSAVAVVLILVTTSPTNQPSNDSARRVDSHSVVTTDDARMSQSDADLTEVDALVSETLASVDEVWDRGEVDIDRLLTDGSRK